MIRYPKVRLATLAGLAIVAAFSTREGAAQGPVSTRPISDFVKVQGTYCVDDGMGGCFLFVPPVQNFLGQSDPKRMLGLSVDYAGLVDRYLGAPLLDTTFDGKITVRPLPDGRAEVTVSLHTKNALTWAIPFDPNSTANQFGENPLLFGARITDVLTGAKPALGESFLMAKFINTAVDAPMPDLIQLLFAPLPGQEVSTLFIRAQADGELRAAFGVPDGTPGRVESSQTGLLTKTMGRPGVDGFPAETIILRPVGR